MWGEMVMSLWVSRPGGMAARNGLDGDEAVSAQACWWIMMREVSERSSLGEGE